VSSPLSALAGVPRDYAWGSPTAIPELLGIEATGEPIAELWFDDQLPFLLKILAADKALSIQVHPTLAQARAGFAAENARGLALDAPSRNYRDANHKPELICALTDFDALCGFRPVPDTLRLFQELDVAELIPVRDALTGPDGLRAAFAIVLATAPSERARLVAAVLAGCRRLLSGGGEWLLSARASLLAARDFPGDLGAVLALLLNAVRLQPGQAIYLGAGNVHAYLRGMGVEIMANSDNVLRCGLTPKHIDIPEVMRVADFTPLANPRCEPLDQGPHERIFPVPVSDFELGVLDIDGPFERAGARATVLLCTSGGVEVSTPSGATPVSLTPGLAAQVAAGRAVTITGQGTVFHASSRAS
jgi:mannose-6-phosphate isomerase